MAPYNTCNEKCLRTQVEGIVSSVAKEVIGVIGKLIIQIIKMCWQITDCQKLIVLVVSMVRSSEGRRISLQAILYVHTSNRNKYQYLDIYGGVLYVVRFSYAQCNVGQV